MSCQRVFGENKEKNGRADVELGLQRVGFHCNWDHTFACAILAHTLD